LLLDRSTHWSMWLYRVLLAVTAVIMSVSMLVEVLIIRDLRRSQECRFDLSAEVNAIGDRIDVATARGLRAVALEDERALLEQAAIIDEQTALQEPAIARRENAVEECR
jgi:hypothetical protein